MDPPLQLGAAQGADRDGSGGFDGGRQRRQQGDAETDQGALEQQQGLQQQMSYREHEIEIVDGAGHQMHQKVGGKQPQQQTQGGTDQAQQTGFQQQQLEQGLAGDAEQAQGGQQLAAAQHREGHGVVDQKGAHQQGQQAHGGQVGLECLDHLAHDPGAGGRLLQTQRRGQGIRQPLRLGRLQDQIDAVEPFCVSQQFLGRADVGHAATLPEPQGYPPATDRRCAE